MRHRQTRVHVDAIRFHPADRIRATIPNQDLPFLRSRSLVYERPQLAIIESLISFNHCRNLSDLHRRLLVRIGLDLENVDRVPHTCAVSMSHEDAVAGNPEPTRIALAIEISAFPFARRFIFYGWDCDDPMQMLEIAEEVQLLFQRRRPGFRILL